MAINDYGGRYVLINKDFYRSGSVNHLSLFTYILVRDGIKVLLFTQVNMIVTLDFSRATLFDLKSFIG